MGGLGVHELDHLGSHLIIVVGTGTDDREELGDELDVVAYDIDKTRLAGEITDRERQVYVLSWVPLIGADKKYDVGSGDPTAGLPPSLP